MIDSDTAEGQAALIRELATRLQVPVLADLAACPAGAAAVLSVGSAARREELEREAAAAGRSLPALAHADTTLGRFVSIGSGTLISPGARVTGNVAVGRCCQIHTNAVFSHDDVLGTDNRDLCRELWSTGNFHPWLGVLR